MSDTMLVGDIKWTLSPAGDSLLRPEMLDLQAHITAGRTTTIKHGPHRTVYRVQLPQGAVYWKHCRLNGSRAWWREVLRGPKAALEYRKIEALAARGIPSIEPLAWGTLAGRWPRGSYLITRELANTVPLSDYLNTQPFRTFRSQCLFTIAFADWTAHLHDAGVFHPDFHPGNILVRDHGSEWQFYLLDVHDVELDRRLNRRQRARNLMLINRWFQMRAGRAARLRFWTAYKSLVMEAPTPQAIETLTMQSNIHLWLARDRRCVRNNREFCVLTERISEGYALRNLPFEPALFANNPDAPISASWHAEDWQTTRVLKDSRTSSVVLLTHARLGAFVYKRFRLKQWYARLVNCVRPSPALRSWYHGHAMIARGLPTPQPLCLFQQRGIGPGTGYLLCPFIPNAQTLHEVARTATVAERRVLIDQIARLIRLLHERGLTHRDLKPANLLVTRDGVIQFIDLVGMKTLRRVRRTRRIRDLVRLNAGFLNTTTITRADRLRFLRMYLCWALHGRAGWKEWWRALARGTTAKVRQNARRGRPLA